MKHLYALVFSLMAFAFGASAQDTQDTYSFFLNIDNAEAVTVTKYATVIEVHDGINEIEFQPYDQFYIRANAGYLIIGGKTAFGYDASVQNNAINFSTTIETNGKTWEVYTVKESEFRTSSFELWVDDPTGVRAALGGTGTAITGLVEGSNTVAYNAEKETYITVESANYSKPLYKVLIDGEEVERPQYGGQFSVYLSEGCKVEVFCDYPDIKVPVKFNFVNEGTEAFITYVAIDYVEVPAETYLADDFSVQLGSYLSISADTNKYKVDSATLNGEFAGFYGSWGGNVFGEMTFDFEVHEYGTFTKKFIADHPEHIKLYMGNSYYGTLVEFTDGEAIVEVNENNPGFQLLLNDGYKLVKLLDGEDDLTANYSTYNNFINVATTGDVVINTEEIAYDKKYVVYFDDFSLSTYTSFYDNQRKSYTSFQSGYNIFKFFAEMSPFQVSWWGTPVNHFYLNGEKQTGMYSSETMYMFDVEDGDVAKFFWAADPESYKLNIVNNYGEELGCTVDLIVPVTEFGESTVFQGTQVEFTAPEGKTIKVTVGENEPETVENYTLTVDADTEITIDNPETTGIVGIGDKFTDNKVYNMQGMYLGTKAELNRLPAGIYIVGGKKVVKK